MHRLGGKVIPNSNPPVRFKLNHNSTRLQPGEPDTSIWVGDLSPDVDDYALYQFFSHRFQTVRCAKVSSIPLSCKESPLKFPDTVKFSEELIGISGRP